MKRSLLLLVTVSALPACGSSSGGAPSSCGTASTGTLVINVTGLPAPLAPKVTVTGPAGVQVLASGQTLSAAKSGDYTVVASTVTGSDSIVRPAYAATVSTAATKVCDGASVTVTVAYTEIPTSNKLFFGSANGTSDVVGFASSILAATGSPSATIAVSSPGSLPGAFDKDGNLWLINATAGSVGVERYSAASLGSSGTKTPDIVLTSPALSGGAPGPSSIAFGPKGDVWVGVVYSGSVIKFPATAVATGGNFPVVGILGGVPAPNALAFDSAGNLWVGAGDSVLEYRTDLLTSSNVSPPDVTIVAKAAPPVTNTLTGIAGMAFNASGDLWVNYDGTIAKIASSQLASGTITPAVQIEADVLALPEGMAFDESGGLWIAYSAGKFGMFSASQLSASGTFAPAVVISSSSIGSATSPAFFPAPAALPLFSALP